MAVASRLSATLPLERPKREIAQLTVCPYSGPYPENYNRVRKPLVTTADLCGSLRGFLKTLFDESAANVMGRRRSGFRLKYASQRPADPMERLHKSVAMRLPRAIQFCNTEIEETRMITVSLRKSFMHAFTGLNAPRRSFLALTQFPREPTHRKLRC